MIVRGATPRGASGRVYGFVYSGLDLGATIAPVAVGALLDHHEPRALFIAVAVCLFLAIGTVLQVGRSVKAAAAIIIKNANRAASHADTVASCHFTCDTICAGRNVWLECL